MGSNRPVRLLFLLGALLVITLWMQRGLMSAALPAVDYSMALSWVEQGQVARVDLSEHNLQGWLKKPQTIDGKSIEQFRTGIPTGDAELLKLLREKAVGVRVVSEEETGLSKILGSLLPWVLIIGFWYFLSRQTQRMMGAGGPLSGLLKGRTRKFEKNNQPAVTFDDVAGLKSAKQDLMEIVDFLKEPARFRRLGGKVPRGVLLVGPPGTGKTLLARAVAGESGVPFYSISASEFIELFVGVGAARVRELFDEAKKNAPAIVFIDEIDAVGRSRGTGLGGGHDEREQTLNQLLSEMDGFNRNDLTVVLAATNRPDVLDPALLRPGRFDRRVMVDRPEIAARKAILGVHTKGKPLAADVDLGTIAGNTAGFSGADIANLVNEAALTATRRGAEALAARDFSEALDKIVLGDPRDAKLDQDEKKRVAAHESGHAIVALFSPDAEPVHRVSIIPRGMALGVTQQTPIADRHLMTEPQLRTRLAVLMGGYAAERKLFGDVSNGAENDLKEATEIASRMVAHWGMSKKLGPAYYEHHAEHPFLGQHIATESAASDATTQTIESEARTLLNRAVADATGKLEEHRDALDRLIATLLTHETVERDELRGLPGLSDSARVH
ncbi:MAG TPA: ATP-dependent zinc metalloprotease FtsH [Polyangiaceae bacterium]|nr:ATP-dependent zinc metalloprotease FtsH [Polyangiaceae bacterium]